MKQSDERDCKIVRDILPNYIEKLTSEVTNEFVEKHIAGCRECRKAIQNMTGEVELEEFNQEEEINYLKRLNRKVKMKIAVVSLIVIIIASSVSIYVYNKNKMQINNYTFMKAEYVVKNQEGTIDGNLYGTLIAVIGTNGECKSVRVVEKGYNEERIQEQYEEMSKFLDYNTNISIVGSELHYNTNIWNKFNEDEIKVRWIEKYEIDKIEEI